MENKYLIVSDLDGTLLNDEKKIPESTAKYLKKLYKQGYKIVFASGRPVRNVLFFCKKLGLKIPIIGFNGLYTTFPDDVKNNKKFFFDKENIKEILKKLEKKIKIKNIFLSSEDCIYAIDKDAVPDFWKQNMKSVSCSLDKMLEKKFLNFVFELENKDDKKEIKKILKKFKKNKVCFWVGEYDGFVEIYYMISDKYRAIMHVAKKLNIKPENIFAFGNDLNDVEFLSNLKNAYAMKNSDEYIKEKSHLFTKYSNNNCGVEKELKVILKNLK